MKPLAAALALVTTLLVVGFAAAQPLPTTKPEQVGLSPKRLEWVTQTIKAQISDGRFPGAVVLIARKGKIAYFEAFGHRDSAAGAAMSKDAIFRLYSMTKPFTSVAAMMLAEDGKLALADPVSKYFPQLADLQVAVAGKDADGKMTHTLVKAERPITVQDLLRHTSGFVYGAFTPNEHVKAEYSKLGIDWRDVTPAEQIERLAQAPLAHQPGTAWEYSLSTDVLGRVVEKVSGVPLGTFFTERVFAPLKMKDTAFVVPKDKLARLAQPFPVNKETGKAITLLDVTVPQKNDAGGAGSAGTAGDYARFLQMLLNGGQLDGARLLSRVTVAYMTADHLDTIKPAMPGLVPGYGFGLGFAVRKGNGVANVPGSAGEFSWGGAAGTGFWVDPKEQLVVVVMTQTVPGAAAQRLDRARWRQAVYQALAD
jgi:CubicO group peptidase (beta-lactamase class C family)